MGIEIKSNFKPNVIAKQIMDNAGVKMGRLVEELATEIVRRTDQGKTIEGGAMAPYTPKYLAWRKNRGYSARPNLTIRGEMLRSVHTQVHRFKDYLQGLIYVNLDQADKVRGTGQKRPWFGLSKVQLKKIQEALANLYE